MNSKPKHTRLFWLIFVPLFVATSFIPVLPIYKGVSDPILLWIVPIWAIYAALFAMPEWFLFSCPVVVSHMSICYLIARRTERMRQSPIRFSLLSLLTASSILATCIALIAAFADIGFCMFFLGCLMTVTIANYLQCTSILGLPIPKMNQTILIGSVMLCGVMLFFGYPMAVSRIAG